MNERRKVSESQQQLRTLEAKTSADDDRILQMQRDLESAAARSQQTQQSLTEAEAIIQQLKEQLKDGEDLRINLLNEAEKAREEEKTVLLVEISTLKDQVRNATEERDLARSQLAKIRSFLASD
jgi:chromosome segregation ATPase